MCSLKADHLPLRCYSNVDTGLQHSDHVPRQIAVGIALLLKGAVDHSNLSVQIEGDTPID